MTQKQFWMTVLAVIVAQVLAGLVAFTLTKQLRGKAGVTGG